MDYRRHYVFHGHAAAFGGHLIRPKDIVLEDRGASALTASGGRSVGQATRTSFDGFFELDSATTLAEGRFEDPAQFLELTHQRVDESTMAATDGAWIEGVRKALARFRAAVVAHKAELP